MPRRLSKNAPAAPRHCPCEARARFETGDPGNGLNDLDRAVDLAPDNAAIRNQRGIVLGAMGHPDLQIEECRTALQHAPGDNGILHNLAVCLIDTDRAAEALPIFDDLVERRGSASDWGWRGKCKTPDRPARRRNRRPGTCADAG